MVLAMGIAARIRSRREALHLTQQEVAARVSAARDDAATHQADVSNWERGLSTPSTPVLAPLEIGRAHV